MLPHFELTNVAHRFSFKFFTGINNNIVHWIPWPYICVFPRLSNGKRCEQKI